MLRPFSGIVALLGSLVSIAALTSIAHADPNRPPPSAAAAQTLARARDHFVLGMQLFEARNYGEALREFHLVETLAPSAELWFNIGRAHEELGEYADASRAFQAYLRDSVDARDQSDVRAHIAELDRQAQIARERAERAPNSGSLRIHLRSGSALVLLDGKALSRETLDEPLLLPSGRHRLDVSEIDHIPIHAQLDIEPGLLTAAYADLQPKTQARTRAPSHALAWNMLGVSAAGAIASGVFAGVALARQSDGDVRAAKAWAERTDVALAGTAVCALAAIVLYYIEDRTARSELSRTLVSP
jgi:tetratricopeptide (TPR) repeat protein